MFSRIQRGFFTSYQRLSKDVLEYYGGPKVEYVSEIRHLFATNI